MKRQGAINLSIESRLENVPLVGIAVNKLCREAGFDRETADLIELGLVEATNNAIIHAYQSESGHRLEVAVNLNSMSVVLQIKDWGRSMGEWSVTEVRFDPQDIRAVPEGGFGRFLIHKIMDKVEYQSKGGQNTLTLTKMLAQS